MRQKFNKKLARGFTLIELMIVVAIIGILAAIAVPNLLKFQARTRQGEAKLNLKAYYTAAKARFGMNTKYSCDLCGWKPEAGYRYNYFTSTGTAGKIVDGEVGCTESNGGVTAAVQTDADATAGVTGAFTASAAGNIDADTTCDGWNINDANQLTNPRNDVDS